MVQETNDLRSSTRTMAYTAAAMYGATALDGAIEGFLPGDPQFSVLPVLAVLVIVAVLITVGPGLPRATLALLGPLGVALIAYALAATPGPGDGAVLYALPVLWTTLFFGRRGAIAILASVGVAHALSLLAMPASTSYPGRWVDVMVSVCSMAIVVLALDRRHDLLLRRLADEARTDALTGLMNRRGFDERAAVELAHLRRDGGRIAVARFDVDRFKHINDEWGHEMGDRVLAQVGLVLAAQAREVDVAGRLGGDEFGVLLPGGGEAEAYALTERIRLALAQSTQGLPTISISAGVAAAEGAASIEVLLRRADEALYEAKRAGRGRVAVGSSVSSLVV